jgi:hypothetical protein
VQAGVWPLIRDAVGYAGSSLLVIPVLVSLVSGRGMFKPVVRQIVDERWTHLDSSVERED